MINDVKLQDSFKRKPKEKRKIKSNKERKKERKKNTYADKSKNLKHGT